MLNKDSTICVPLDEDKLDMCNNCYRYIHHKSNDRFKNKIMSMASFKPKQSETHIHCDGYIEAKG